MNKEEMTIHLDFSGCQTAMEFHHRIKSAFHFPDWYGCNWDAFFDLLHTDVEENQIIISGLNTLPAELHDSIPCLLTILAETKKERLAFGDIFTYEIRN